MVLQRCEMLQRFCWNGYSSPAKVDIVPIKLWRWQFFVEMATVSSKSAGLWKTGSQLSAVSSGNLGSFQGTFANVAVTFDDFR